MKTFKFLLFKTVFLLVVLLTCNLIKAQVNGEIVTDTANIRIIKVWGTHYERAYAYGYIDALQILKVYNGYIKNELGTNLESARQNVSVGGHFKIAEKYRTEAKGMIDGMKASGANVNIDDIDILVYNSFFDLLGFPNLKKKRTASPVGCSSLMSWGDATLSTELEGKSVISRHLDWSKPPVLIQNMVIVANIPSEPDEQAWLMIGFAGQISALSAVNNNGLVAFQHDLADFKEPANLNEDYEPIWFAIRNGIEKKDFNSDNENNVSDLRDALSVNKKGYANAVIVSCMGPAQNRPDSLIAMVAELTCGSPALTFRSNSYEDKIPGDNLYAANNSIKRNDLRLYSTRYNNIVDHIGNGNLIGAQENWTLMRDYSHLANNIQFMQIIPEKRILKISVTDSKQLGWQKEPITLYLDSLLGQQTTGIENQNENAVFNIFPNPAKDEFNIKANTNFHGTGSIEIFDILGIKLKSIPIQMYRNLDVSLNLKLKEGLYFFKLNIGHQTIIKKVVILH